MANPQSPPPSPPPTNSPKPSGKGAPRSDRNAPTNVIWILVIGGLIVTAYVLYNDSHKEEEVETSKFIQGVKNGTWSKQNVYEAKISRGYIRFFDRSREKGEKNKGDAGTEALAKVKPKAYAVPIVSVPDAGMTELQNLLSSKDIEWTSDKPPSDVLTLLSLWVPVLVLLLMIYLMFRRVSGAGTAISFGRSRGRMHAQEDLDVTFDHVAGEAGVPFISLSGSDFVEMFVGVGAARVRDMFSQAAAKSPSIIFIDELDALGKVRGSGMPGGHDERDQTLNALLVEMDGFSSDQSVIVMAATNRPETLDPALLRPGRFDRHVLVDRPDVKGREAILKVHMGKIKVADSVDLKHIAGLTPGFVGADLANLVNEAALLAARKDKTKVSMHEFEEGIERVVAGLEKQTRIILPDEKQRVAYHECGHALVACSLPHTDPVHKISIIPRGFAALGYTLQRPEDERYLVTQSELTSRVCVLLGGITAEEIIYNETSTGAQNDLERATDIARRMVMEFGMSRTLGRVNYRSSNRSPFLANVVVAPSDYVHSEETIREIDLEVKRIVDEAAQTVFDVLTERREVLEHMSRELVEREVMDAEVLKRILDEHTTSPQIKPGTHATTSREPEGEAEASVLRKPAESG